MTLLPTPRPAPATARDRRETFVATPVAGAAATLLWLAASAASAQTAPAPATATATAGDATLSTVTVDARAAAPQADVSGFGDLPLREVPLSATVIDSATLRATGARRLADLTQFDASVTDAYNSAGYWDYLTVRGFVLDNQYSCVGHILWHLR